MALNAAYSGDLSRVQLSASDLDDSPDVATYAIVERSHNELLWVTVRGGAALPVSSGEAELDDYEFFLGAATHYRIRSFDENDVQLQEYTTNLTVSEPLVWLKSLRHPMLNLPVRPADQDDLVLADRSQALPVSGRSLPVGMSDPVGGRDHVLHLRTDSRADEDGLLLRLRVGRDFYVQVPGSGVLADILPGSMHVLIGAPRKHRAGGVTDVCVFALPLTEVAAPSPEVVPTNLTVGTVINTYGSISALWAAHPSIRDLWDTVGSPDDLLAL
jgi:hypothetical protein